MTALALEVVDPGALTTVQDHGRPGYAHLGVPRSGAVDVAAADHANTLVGNPPGTAVLETTATGCTVRATAPTLVAVTGAPCPVFVGSVPAPFGSPVRLAAGQSLELAPPEHGLRTYLAVRGGIAVEPVLGSRSTDTLSGLGPDPLARGDLVPIGPGEPATDEDFAALRSGRVRDPSRASAVVELLLHLGPRTDWFTESAVATLLSGTYEVSSDSNRVGLRLTGPELERARDGEIVSEGMVLGAVQVPPSGQPVVFLADHPTTGGYPVIGVIDPSSRQAAAQARPGDPVRFAAIYR